MKKIFSGSSLKIIAIVTMVIDHIAASFLKVGEENYEQFSIAVSSKLAWLWQNLLFLQNTDQLHRVYTVMRGIGRISFPLFAFCLIEGYLHTHDKRKYLLRMLIFALLSEPLFDLAFWNRGFYMGYQNIFFTLILAFLVMVLWDYLEGRSLWQWLMVLAIGGLGSLLNVDYGAIGIWLIFLMFYTRRRQPENGILMESIVGAVGFSYEITAPLAFLFVLGYNGKKGLSLKYVFYWIYPVHLALLAILKHYMYA